MGGARGSKAGRWMKRRAVPGQHILPHSHGGRGGRMPFTLTLYPTLPPAPQLHQEVAQGAALLTATHPGWARTRARAPHSKRAPHTPTARAPHLHQKVAQGAALIHGRTLEVGTRPQRRAQRPLCHRPHRALGARHHAPAPCQQRAWGWHARRRAVAGAVRAQAAAAGAALVQLYSMCSCCI